MEQLNKLSIEIDWNIWYKQGYIEIPADIVDQVHPNQFIVLTDSQANEVAICNTDIIRPIAQYNPSGIQPKNIEQNIALHLLSDFNIPLKILSGVAGSGKTLLACAHAIEQLNNGSINKIIIAKSMVPIGRDIGYLKGDIYEKVRPWLWPFYDNFIECGIAPYQLDKWIEQDKIEITPITFIQGRSFHNSILIVDEAQHLPLKIIKQIVTRAGYNSEIILLGDPSQNFSRTKLDSLEKLIQYGKDSDLVGYVKFTESLRSPLALWAVQNIDD